jgi:polyisoprenoid-binding protein YceI
MKKLILTLAVAGLGLSAIATPPAKKADESFNVDTKASTFKWLATKVTGEHYGVANFSKGVVTTNGKTLTGGEIVVDMTSIDATDLTGEYHDKLVGHLKSDDFFSTEKYNTANLVVKSAKPLKADKAGNNYTIVANLTIKGITQEVTFPAIVVVNAKQVIVNANFDIDRTKYDIKYGSKSFIEGIGDKAISDMFNVKVRVVAAK